MAAPAELSLTRGPPAHIKLDHGPEYIATAVRRWLAKIGAETLYIYARQTVGGREPRVLNWSMRHELLDREIFFILTEATS